MCGKKRSAKRALLFLCAAVMLLMLTPAKTMAATLGASVCLPISQSVSSAETGNAPAAVSYTLTAAEEDAPMPAGAENGVYQFTLTGKTNDKLPAIAPERAGVWNYVLSANAENAVVSPQQIAITITAVQHGDTLAVYTSASLADGQKTDLSFAVSQQTQPPAPEVSSSPAPPPSHSSKPGSENKPGTPKTGDDTDMTPYAVTAGVSFLALVLLAVKRRKENEQSAGATD